MWFFYPSEGFPQAADLLLIDMSQPWTCPGTQVWHLIEGTELIWQILVGNRNRDLRDMKSRVQMNGSLVPTVGRQRRPYTHHQLFLRQNSTKDARIDRASLLKKALLHPILIVTRLSFHSQLTNDTATFSWILGRVFGNEIIHKRFVSVGCKVKKDTDVLHWHNSNQKHVLKVLLLLKLEGRPR